MKAKEYFKIYEDRILEDAVLNNSVEAAKDLLKDMWMELDDIVKKRNAKKIPAVIGAVKEQNQKWNAICNLFEEAHGVSPLKRNAFGKFVELEIPQLKGKILPNAGN